MKRASRQARAAGWAERRRPFALALCAQCVLGLCATRALAKDDEHGLMSEPLGYTDVLDAFDGTDPFDINVGLAFIHSTGGGDIQREVADERTIDGRASSNFIDVARHDWVKNELLLGLEVGLYHDLMLFGRLPIVLGESRELDLPESEVCRDSSQEFEVCTALEEPLADDPSGDERQNLFELAGGGLSSAKRSGIPHIDFGIAWAVTNQHRGSHLGTWVLRVQTSVSTGEVMEACLAGSMGCSAGISRGTSTLRLESRWSRRYRYLEPFVGIGHTIEWVTSGEDLFTPAGELAGDPDPTPPSTTFSTLGTAIVPWEDRRRFQRLAVELRTDAAYISAGRDYSPLFDALGTSPVAYLSAPQPDRASGPGVNEVAFTGLTHVQEHARLGVRGELVMQAARYVRFSLGVALQYLTPHLLTGEPVCNRGVDADADDPRAGDCSQGVRNPAHRAVIDAPGKRFRLNSDSTVDLFVSATGQF